MRSVGGGTFSGFLQFLTSFPAPNSVVEGAARGPLAQFGCQVMNLWLYSQPTELISIGEYGLGPYDFHRYSRVSLSVSSPLTESFITSSTIILPISDMTTNYPALMLDQDFWDNVTEQNGNGDVGQVPIFAKGVPIGAYSFLCDRINEWNPRATAVLDGLSAALALWMSNPSSNILGATFNGNHEGLSLTSRQIEILDLVGQGKSNAYISARLGFSHSTVKQELQRVMKRLKVNDRTSAVTRAMDLQLLSSPPPHPTRSSAS